MNHIQRIMVVVFVSLFGLGTLGFSYLMGYTPQRVYAKIRTSGPQLLEELKKEILFDMQPKEVVAEPQSPGAHPLQVEKGNEFNGPLRVSTENPRYFSDASGNIVYLTGSHTWSNLQDNGGSNPPPAFDYNAYLDFLVDNNHNFFRLWTWEQSRWTLETSDNNYWFSPMPYQRTGPGNALDGQPKFDLTKFNQDYFDRLRERVIAAGDRGIYVSIMLFDGWSIEDNKGGFGENNPWRGHPFNSSNNINGIDGDSNHDDSGTEVHTLQNPDVTALQDAYVRKVIDTVDDLDNVLYEIVNESHTGSNAWQEHMVNLIKTYETSKGKQHPVGMTVNWPGGDNADLYNGPADWISPNGDADNPPLGDGTKVVLADTDHLCGICGNRKFVWKSFTRGLNPIFMDGYDGEGYGVGGAYFDPNDPTWIRLRKNMGYALTYANRMNLKLATPRGDLCSTDYCLANPASDGTAEFLVYLPSGGSVTVDLSAVNGSIRSEWLDPENGQVTAGGSTNGGGNRQFSAPFSGDAVLYLSQTDAPTPTPGPTPVPNIRRYIPIAVRELPRPGRLNPEYGQVTAGGSTTGGGHQPFSTPSSDEAVLYLSQAAVSTPIPRPALAPSIRRYIPITVREAHSGGGTQPPPVSGSAFLETFDGEPTSPKPFASDHWDIQVHSRDNDTWYQLEPMQAAHGPNCEGPPSTHLISSYEDAVYQCRNHTMTAINASGYGVIYLTPDHLVDFSNGEAVIKFDMSTLRTSARDWVDIWITPYEDNLTLPLTDWLPDLNGEPRQAIRFTLGTSTPGGNLSAERIENFAVKEIDGVWWVTYDEFLEPSAMRRDTFEIRISRNHLKAGMPDYNFWWVDADIAPLDWSVGVVQFGHHSYNPTKECSGQNCGPNTWHWDNISIDPAIPFTIIHSDVDFVNQRTSGEAVFSQPAPPDSHLRFAANGDHIQISLNNGASWMNAAMQSQERVSDGGFNSYWTPIPEGVTSVLFRGEDNWAGEWLIRGISIFSLSRP